MFISGDSPTRSVRAVPSTARSSCSSGARATAPAPAGTPRGAPALEAFAREHWDVSSVEYRWSAQDNTTVDTLPYVGPLTPFSDRILMATGFAKWGMTGGTAAALILAARLRGEPHPAEELFDPNRLNARASVGRLIKGERAGRRALLRRPAHQARARGLEDLKPGEGDIVRHDGEKVAGYRDEDGTLHAVSPVCSHLGCQVNWNSAERSWDCPCHGSRFAPGGEVLHGPAVHRLEIKPT